MSREEKQIVSQDEITSTQSQIMQRIAKQWLKLIKTIIGHNKEKTWDFENLQFTAVGFQNTIADLNQLPAEIINRFKIKEFLTLTQEESVNVYISLAIEIIGDLSFKDAFKVIDDTFVKTQRDALFDNLSAFSLVGQDYLFNHPYDIQAVTRLEDELNLIRIVFKQKLEAISNQLPFRKKIELRHNPNQGKEILLLRRRIAEAEELLRTIRDKAKAATMTPALRIQAHAKYLILMLVNLMKRLMNINETKDEINPSSKISKDKKTKLAEITDEYKKIEEQIKNLPESVQNEISIDNIDLGKSTPEFKKRLPTAWRDRNINLITALNEAGISLADEQKKQTSAKDEKQILEIKTQKIIITYLINALCEINKLNQSKARPSLRCRLLSCASNTLKANIASHLERLSSNAKKEVCSEKSMTNLDPNKAEMLKLLVGQTLEECVAFVGKSFSDAIAAAERDSPTEGIVIAARKSAEKSVIEAGFILLNCVNQHRQGTSAYKELVAQFMIAQTIIQKHEELAREIILINDPNKCEDKSLLYFTNSFEMPVIEFAVEVGTMLAVRSIETTALRTETAASDLSTSFDPEEVSSYGIRY